MKASLIVLGALASLVIGCEDKPANEDSGTDTSSSTSRVVGSGGGTGTTNDSGEAVLPITIGAGPSFADISSSGFTISWAAATSTDAPDAPLEYQLVTAGTTDALATLEQAEAVATGDVVLPFTAGVLSHTVTGLGASETHAYAVIVKDGAGNKALYPAASVTTLALDAPKPGADITFGLITDTSFSIYWGAATSTITDQESLQYRVVLATNASSISTIAGALAVTGSDVVLDWTANRVGATYIPSGVVQGALTYAAAVLVKDANGTMAIYTPKQVTTLHHKLIFRSAPHAADTLGVANDGSIGADTACNAEKPAGRGTFKALLAIPTVREACRTHAYCELNDTILTNDGFNWVMTRDTFYENASGGVIWKTNAAGVVSTHDYTPGAIESDNNRVWTGLKQDWTIGNTCNGWTSNTSGQQGEFGLSSANYSVAWGASSHTCDGWLQIGGSYLQASVYCVEQ